LIVEDSIIPQGPKRAIIPREIQLAVEQASLAHTVTFSKVRYISRLVYVMSPCRRPWRWRLCAARAICPL